MFRKRIGYRFEDSEVAYIYFKVMMRLLMGFSHFFVSDTKHNILAVWISGQIIWLKACLARENAVEEFVVCCFVLLQIYSMSSYQSLADIASNRADGVDDPNLSSGKIYSCIILWVCLFNIELFGAIIWCQSPLDPSCT